MAVTATEWQQHHTNCETNCEAARPHKLNPSTCSKYHIANSPPCQHKYTQSTTLECTHRSRIDGCPAQLLECIAPIAQLLCAQSLLQQHSSTCRSTVINGACMHSRIHHADTATNTLTQHAQAPKVSQMTAVHQHVMHMEHTLTRFEHTTPRNGHTYSSLHRDDGHTYSSLCGRATVTQGPGPSSQDECLGPAFFGEGVNS
jgi:hypothetical protein